MPSTVHGIGGLQFSKVFPRLISNDKRSVCGIFSESIHPHFDFFRLKTPIHLMFVRTNPASGLLVRQTAYHHLHSTIIRNDRLFSEVGNNFPSLSLVSAGSVGV